MKKKAAEKLSPEVLHMLRMSAEQLAAAQRQHESAQVGHNALVAQVVGLYRLKETDSVDLETGVITRSE